MAEFWNPTGCDTSCTSTTGFGAAVSVRADERPVEDVTREVLVALEVLQAVVGQVPYRDRRSIDPTGLEAAFGAAASGG